MARVVAGLRPAKTGKAPSPHHLCQVGAVMRRISDFSSVIAPLSL